MSDTHERLMIVTATDDESKLALLRESLEWNGYRAEQMHVIPWEKDYVTTKVRRVIQWINASGYEYPSNYLMWVDGHDSLVLKPESKILNALVGSSTFISAERNCYPDPDLADCFPILNPSSSRFPCAGGWVGETRSVLSALQHVLYCASDGDDQRAWTKAILARVLDIAIDTERKFFCSEGDGDTAHADPCVRHWNGRAPGRELFWEEWKRSHARA